MGIVGLDKENSNINILKANKLEFIIEVLRDLNHSNIRDFEQNKDIIDSVKTLKNKCIEKIKKNEKEIKISNEFSFIFVIMVIIDLYLKNVKSLDLSGNSKDINDIDDNNSKFRFDEFNSEGLLFFYNCKDYLANLEYLNLSNNNLNSYSMYFFRRNHFLKNLKKLVLSNNNLGLNGIKNFCKFKFFENLLSLELNNVGLNHECFIILSKWIFAKQIKEFFLCENDIFNENIIELIEHGSYENLDTLDLKNNNLTSELIEILAQCVVSKLKNLKKLDLLKNKINENFLIPSELKDYKIEILI